MQILELIGRIFISLIFLIAGVGKIFNYEGTIGYMESFGVPGYLFIPAIIIEILFPLLLAIIFHTDFSNQMQLMSFLKNFAIAGGFLIIFIRGAGKYSIDYKLN